jgi:putative DNA primase/helicase
MNLQQFYAAHFNSDPFTLLDAAHAELAELAAMAGIDWSACANDIQLNPRGGVEKFSKYANHTPKALEKGLKGRVEVYSRRESTDDGLQYPFINFVRKGTDAGTWSGFQFLLNEYRHAKRQDGISVPVSQAEAERISRQAAARVHREELALSQKFKASQIREEALLGWLAFSQAFATAPREDGSWPYAIRKGIRDVFADCDVRRVTSHDQLKWGRGPTQYMAIPLAHLDGRQDGRIVGWQRVDVKGEKFQTNAVDSGDFVGACCVIGNLDGASYVGTAEGFATGASAWLASQTNKNPDKRFDAVVVAVSAANMIPVIEQLTDLCPSAKLTAILDNDREKESKGKGNTGLRTGFDIKARFPQVKCVYPIFEDDPSLKCSDFNDLYALRGPVETARQLDKSVLQCGQNALSLALRRLKTVPYENGGSFAKVLCKAINVGMLSCPAQISPKNLKHMFCEALRDMGLERLYKSTVVDHINRCWFRKCRVAQSSRSFSERITNPLNRPSHINYRQFDTTEVNDEVRQYINSLNGPVIMRSGMGSGKTKNALRPMMLEATRGILIAHRRSLIGGMHETVTKGLGAKADVLHYQDEGYASQAAYAQKLTICVNSIIKPCWQPLMRNHDFIGLDEATQGIRAILSGKAMGNPVAVFNTLIDAMARTEKTAIMVDADANDLLIDFAELVMKRREELGLPVWPQIHVIDLPVNVKNRETKAPIRVLYTDSARIVTEVSKAVKRGEKILLATDNSALSDVVAANLRSDFPDKKFLLVNADTSEEADVIEFTEKPKKTVLKYDGLIYSPSISSGVSFEKKHFDRHFGVFCGEVVPSDAIQMLRRDRTATEFIVGFDRMRGRRETDPQKIKRGYALAALETALKNGELTDVVLEKDYIHCGVANTDFMEMKLKATAMEAVARNDYANNMICIMYSDGYVIEQMAENEDASAAGKALTKEAKEIIWQEALERHMCVETPHEAEREKLLNKRALSLDEQAQLHRWDIENELKTPVTEASLKFYLDGGLSKVRAMETVLLDEMTARRLDREEALVNFGYAFKTETGQWHNFTTSALTREEADAVFNERYPGIKPLKVKETPRVEMAMRHYYGLKSRLLKKYLQDCGIDPETLIGEATPQQQKLARDNLFKPEMLDLLNVLRIGGYTQEKSVPKQPATVLKSICASLGLTTETRRAHDSDKRPTLRYIEPESAEFIREILEKRKEAGLALQARKVENTAVETDRDLDLSIYTDGKSRSTDLDVSTSPESAISEALAALPVDIPEEWAETVLPADAMTGMRKWAVSDIARTLASLYLTECMHRLSAIEFRLLAAFASKDTDDRFTLKTGQNGPIEALYG